MTEDNHAVLLEPNEVKQLLCTVNWEGLASKWLLPVRRHYAAVTSETTTISVR
jgi:hypothetical protein